MLRTMLLRSNGGKTHLHAEPLTNSIHWTEESDWAGSWLLRKKMAILIPDVVPQGDFMKTGFGH